ATRRDPLLFHVVRVHDQSADKRLIFGAVFSHVDLLALLGRPTGIHDVTLASHRPNPVTQMRKTPGPPHASPAPLLSENLSVIGFARLEKSPVQLSHDQVESSGLPPFTGGLRGGSHRACLLLNELFSFPGSARERSAGQALPAVKLLAGHRDAHFEAEPRWQRVPR